MSAAALLTQAFCAIDDGDINACGRALYRVRSMVAKGATLSESEQGQLSWLDSMYHACCGSQSGWASR